MQLGRNKVGYRPTRATGTVGPLADIAVDHA
jgi:hypothetical protein